LPSGIFSAAQTTARTRTLGLEQRNGAHGADHRRAAGHIVLHLVHVGARLEGDAAGVEGDALADQAENRAAIVCGRALGLIAQDDQGGRLGRALRDAPEGSHLQLMQLFGRVDLAAQADFGGHPGGACPEDGGGQLVARLVDQRTGEVLAFADDDGLGEGGLEAALSASAATRPP
jgi:hypothetical protein